MTMTNQEINERVAKLCGWTIKTNTGLFFDSSDKPHVDLPNYAESLDACSSFEDFSTGEEWDIYLDNLNEICDGENDPVVATPLQRCEAFLRMKGQWE